MCTLSLFSSIFVLPNANSFWSYSTYYFCCYFNLRKHLTFCNTNQIQSSFTFLIDAVLLKGSFGSAFNRLLDPDYIFTGKDVYKRQSLFIWRLMTMYYIFVIISSQRPSFTKSSPCSSSAWFTYFRGTVHVLSLVPIWIWLDCTDSSM